jgi:ATP-binding cassette subfamily C protein
MSGREYRQQFAASASHLLDSIRGMKEILILGRQEASLRQINENGKKLNDCLGRLNIQKSVAVALPEMLITLAVMTTFGLALSWRLPLDRMIILLTAVASSFGPVTALSALSVDLLNVFAAAGRIFKILDEESAVEDGGREEDLVCDGSAGFAGVDFSYPDSDTPVLRQFSLAAQPGEKIALVGPSGCGKSTALRLLLRYFDPRQGRISLSGLDIRRLPLKTLRRHVAMLTQDVFLFDESIAYNIKLGHPDAGEEQVKAAARCALIHDFIEALPQGYRTRVGELGDRLSGGEKQRIGIARVLLSGAGVIVLDEPTSNLDALNEKGILAILKREFADRTLLMVSHRLAAVQWADRIHRVAKGAIQENKPQDLAPEV